jgi:8-oxo-dGTP pyrophosphatase MutT (NUDIX family)
MNASLKNGCEAEMAAGGLVWDVRGPVPKVAVIHRPKHDDWSLPKGKQDPGETLLETARREVTEELGCRFQVDSFAGVTSYPKSARPKVVLFWNMTRLDDLPFQPNKEVDEVRWLSPEEALALLTHATERELLRSL